MPEVGIGLPRQPDGPQCDDALPSPGVRQMGGPVPLLASGQVSRPPRGDQHAVSACVRGRLRLRMTRSSVSQRHGRGTGARMWPVRCGASDGRAGGEGGEGAREGW